MSSLRSLHRRLPRSLGASIRAKRKGAGKNRTEVSSPTKKYIRTDTSYPSTPSSPRSPVVSPHQYPRSPPSTPSAHALNDVSPSRKGPSGGKLSDYRNVVLDMCALTVTLMWTGRGKPPASFVDDFKGLLRAENIHYRRLDSSWGTLAHHSLRIRDAEDFRRLLCKRPRALRTVAPL
jgi:hypothetical protein